MELDVFSRLQFIMSCDATPYPNNAGFSADGQGDRDEPSPGRREYEARPTQRTRCAQASQRHVVFQRCLLRKPACKSLTINRRLFLVDVQAQQADAYAMVEYFDDALPPPDAPDIDMGGMGYIPEGEEVEPERLRAATPGGDSDAAFRRR